MVKAAYSSGKPAYGVGAGNSSIVIDETADIEIAAQNTRVSKTSDFGSGCSADGNIIIQKSIYEKMVQALQNEGGYLCNVVEKAMLEAAMWDEKGNRTFPTIACRPQQTADVAGFSIPEDRKFLMVENQGQIGPEHKFSKEKLTTLMALYHFDTFDDALDTVRAIYKTGGIGHSCGIYSHNNKHIDALARVAPVRPYDGAPASIQSQCGFLDKWHAYDQFAGLRHLGWQHHQRERHHETHDELHMGRAAQSPKTAPLKKSSSANFLDRRSHNGRQ